MSDSYHQAGHMLTIRLGIRSWKLALVSASLLVLRAQDAPEPPHALILAASGAHLLRAGSELPLSARPGEILFAGDDLRVDGGSATILSCTAKSQQTLSADADLLFEARGPKLRAGKIADTKPATGCFLPPMSRAIVASQQHAGAAMAIEASREIVSQTFQQRLQQLPDAQRSQLGAALAPIDAALSSNPNDAVRRLERAAALDSAGLAFDAAEEMKQVSNIWPDAGWAKSRLFVLEEKGGKNAAAAKPPEPEVEGNTYALLVGISSFQDTSIPSLNFAHADAIELARLLKSPRAGAIPDDNVVTLTNEKATRGAIQSAIETQLKGRAGKNDTILLFIASHGVMVGKKGFIVAYDSNPQDVATSGIPMDDIRRLFETQLVSVKRLYLYVDVCHAGKVGQISTKADDRLTERSLVAEDLQMFGMLAAQGGQVAYEGINYGGGHGAFSYFLMSGLNGEADIDGDGRVSMSELADYVTDHVKASTVRQQVPKQIGEIDNNRALALKSKPGIELQAYTGPIQVASRSLTPLVPRRALNAPAPGFDTTMLKYQDIGGLLQQFQDAIDQGRILPTDDQSAFIFLDAIQSRRKDAFRPAAEKLRVALEDKGQQVILRYLAGEAAPQKPEDFLRGQIYFESALPLAPDSLYLQSRMFFCQGRAAIFGKDYTGATTLLERAIGLDSERAYAYNALGIVSLEGADYDRAISAFREASRRAPYWAYPMHNLALAYMEKGDFESAIRTYLRAMELAPRVAYLPYNLGLLYQRMNRPRDAEAQYRKALAVDAGNAQALNALGALNAAAGHKAEAEKFYRQALERDPALLAARHNLALLLGSDSKRAAEAPALWRDNLGRDPQHLPSRLALARYLSAAGSPADAAKEYETVVAARPDYAAARLALADLDLKSSKPADAIAQLEEVLKTQGDNPDALERAAQAYAQAGRRAEAEAAWKKALLLATDGPARKRIRQALRAR
ncbi:MAG TPA: tetratricopeptide repeat protein [Candidatus Acidoferrales bacterium]|jgi:tetratricopeptide (TPR) repeat protein|nr:tetratricopeptide repeat protein [Candidatus Acidoferrales bacterium]